MIVLNTVFNAVVATLSAIVAAFVFIKYPQYPKRLALAPFNPDKYLPQVELPCPTADTKSFCDIPVFLHSLLYSDTIDFALRILFIKPPCAVSAAFIATCDETIFLEKVSEDNAPSAIDFAYSLALLLAFAKHDSKA